MVGEVVGPSAASTTVSVAQNASDALFPLLPTVAHEIHQHRHAGCNHLPPALGRLSTFRPETITKDHGGAVLRFLFSSDSAFAKETREVWLKNNRELADVWRDPTADGFAPFATPNGGSPRQALGEAATTLWALGLHDNPQRRSAFTVIVAALGALSGAPRAPRVKDAPRPVARGAERQLKRTLRDQDTELDALREHSRELERQLRRIEGAAASDRHAREQAEQIAVEAANAAATTESKLATAAKLIELRNEQLASAKSELSRARQRGETLERTAQDLSARVNALQEAQARLVGELAQERKARADLVAASEHPENLFRAFLDAKISRLEEEIDVVQGARVLELQAERKVMRDLRKAFHEAFPEFRPRAPGQVVRRAPIKYTGLGGANEVGGSAYLVEISGKNLLIDCGIRVGVTQLDQLGPDLSMLPKLDALVMTHAHVDHIGWLPALRHKTGDELPQIYLTHESSELLPVMLDDSLEQLGRLMARRQLIALHSREPVEVEEPYDARDKDAVLRQYLSSAEFGETNALRGDVRFRFFRAGHILGAASVLIESPDAKIFVTGDFSDFDQRTVDGWGWPEEVCEPDLMIMEATYGKTDHADRIGEVEKFIRDVRRVVGMGGVALIACFALGRAQEVLAILNDAFATGDLKPVPVYMDGMIEDINPVYQRYGRLRLRADLFNGVRGNLWRRDDLIERLKGSPAIIVTTSGMLQGGPVVTYARALLGSRKNQLFLTGYQEESSLGRRVLREATKPGAIVKTWDEDGKEIAIRLATPANEIHLSAHADRRGLLAAVERVRPKNVVLVHGEDAARTHLAEELQRRRIRVADDSSRLEV